MLIWTRLSTWLAERVASWPARLFLWSVGVYLKAFDFKIVRVALYVFGAAFSGIFIGVIISSVFGNKQTSILNSVIEFVIFIVSVGLVLPLAVVFLGFLIYGVLVLFTLLCGAISLFIAGVPPKYAPIVEVSADPSPAGSSDTYLLHHATLVEQQLKHSHSHSSLEAVLALTEWIRSTPRRKSLLEQDSDF